MEENLISIEEYAKKIKQELREIANFTDDENKKIAYSFAKFDAQQVGTIDKCLLVNVIKESEIKIPKKRARELSISLQTKLHGEVSLGEFVALAKSVASTGSIDSSLLKRADHTLPKGHLNLGTISDGTVEKVKNSREEGKIKRAPSCEFLDSVDEMERNPNLLFKMSDYAKKLFDELDSLGIPEEDRVTIAEGFAEQDTDKTGQVPENYLDGLFKSCLRELPGYEIRRIMEARGNDQGTSLTLLSFAEIFMAEKKSDVCNQFKSSGNGFQNHLKILKTHKKPSKVKQAKGLINKKNHEVEISEKQTESYLASHAYSIAERRAFSTWINQHLSSDQDCRRHLPLEVETEALFKCVSDGIILCKAINCAKPGTVDERVMNKSENMNIFQKAENIILGLNSALALGCKVVNIRPDDIKTGVPHLVLGLLWQIIRHSLLSKISLAKNIDIAALLRPGENIKSLDEMNPEQILMRWLNHHLHNSADNDDEAAKILRNKGLKENGEFVGNFGSDLSNSVAFINLLEQISPSKSTKNLAAKAIKIADKRARAASMLEIAKAIGMNPILTPDDIVNGNEKLNLAFLAALFNKHSGLSKANIAQEVLDELDLENLEELENLVEEETREEETYRNWVNSLGLQPFSKVMPSTVSRLYSDLRDGLYLLKIEDEIKPGAVNWSRVHKSYDKWQRHMRCMENCAYAVDVGTKKLNYSLVGINGANIYEMDRTRTLAILWQLMRSYMTKVLSSMDGEIRDNEIMQWCNDTLQKHQKESRVSSFKDKDLAFAVIDLCDVISPGSVDYNMVSKSIASDGFMAPDERLQNAQLAINLSRKIGAKIYASPMDLVEGKQKMILTIFVGLMSRSFEKAEQGNILPV